MKKTITTLLMALLFISGLSFQQKVDARRKPEKTSLEIQAIQAREYDTTRQVAFASVISVFQDLGYIVGSADINTGFITAKSPTKKAKKHMFKNDLTKETKVSAFIENLPQEQIKIRLNFVNSRENIGAWSGLQRTLDKVVEDPKIYQTAFTKIQEAIFIKSALDQKNENAIQVKVTSAEGKNGEEKSESAPKSHLVVELEHLHSLVEKGILTPEEFSAAKRKLLGLSENN